MRRWRWWLAGSAVLALAGGTLALSLLRASPEQIWQEATARSPGELVRYLKRRLDHHDKLEAVFVPMLDWVQRRVERPVDLAEVPTLGRGPRPQNGVAAVSSSDVYVRNIDELRAALMNATAGQTVTLAPGTYIVAQRLRTGHPGTPAEPIVVRPAQRGTVLLQVTATMGIRMTQPHWVIEGLDFQGMCSSHDDCEHALQIVGGARYAVVRDNRMRDFNAHLKVNGEDGSYPDNGRIEYNLLTNSGPRHTLRSVVPIDIVAASGWRVSNNLISNIVKSAGNGVSFAGFMKGGGNGGLFERNLVVCTPRAISQSGVRVGLSFGGGGTAPASCRDQRCIAEFTGGVAQDNVIAHCNDSGLDVNTAVQTTLRHNTLINTAGIQLRGEPSSAEVTDNLLDGAVRARPGSRLETRDNLLVDTREWYQDSDRLELRWARSAPLAGERPAASHPSR